MIPAEMALEEIDRAWAYIVRDLNDAADRADVLATGVDIDRETIDTATRSLAALVAVRGKLAETVRTLETAIAEAMPEKRIEIVGVGQVEKVRRSGTTQWDSEGLLPVVVARALDERKIDVETGEALESQAECVGRVLAECARMSWRVGPLRAKGIDVDEFRATSYGGLTVKMPPAAAPKPAEETTS